ncbi:glycosyltransferase family 2 protein [bacterium]|nr:glycosyltransferase family 2 protein [bacterium]
MREQKEQILSHKKKFYDINNIDISDKSVTFIVSSYNYEKFIEQTLNSIKNQTYKNFEIIVVDDFSTDNSVSIIQNYINNNPDLKISLIRHDKNYGQFKSILTGLEKANGEFISFIDSDDIIYETYAETLLKLHTKTNAGFVSCKAKEIISPEKNDLQTKNILQKDFIRENSVEQDTLIKYKNIEQKPFGGWFWHPMTSTMFKKKSVEIILNYKNTDDWKICPDKFIFNLINLIDGSITVDIELFGKRKHENNAGNFNRTKLNIENNKKIRKLTLNFIKQNKYKFVEKYGKILTFIYVAKIYLSYFYIPIQILKYVTKFFTLKI